MNERLQKIIELKCGGVQIAFCNLMGWSASYLNKLLKGVNFGLSPVLALVEKFPDLNARWLLTGEGEMLNDAGYDSVRAAVRSHVEQVYELEKYIPVMTPSELHEFEEVLFGKKAPSFSPQLVEMWQLRLSQKKESINARVLDAMSKSEKSCKVPEVK